MSLSPGHRLKPIGLALATGLASSLLALSGVGSPSHAAETSADSTSLRIGSYNIRIGAPMDDFRAGVDFIMSVADVAGLQEAGGGNRREFLDGNRSWRIYHAPSLLQTPILWNPKVFELVSARQSKISDAARIDSPHGTVPFKAQYVPVVKLREISTGYVFTMINVHLIHGAVNAGRPRPSSPHTYRVYRKQVKALKSLVDDERAGGNPVYVTGDYNVGYQADSEVRNHKLPYHRLTSISMVANWKGKKLNDFGTHIDPSCPKGRAHCGAYIDQIWAPTKSATSTVYTDVIHSDHYPIMSTYAVPAPVVSRTVAGTIGWTADSVSGPEFNKPWQTRQNPMVFKLEGDMEHGFADVQVTNGSGVEGQDFTVDDSSLYDTDLDNNQVVVETIPNLKREPDKTFTLTLVDPFNTTITNATVTGTILNDD
jgi:hypothetical protein